MSKLKYIISFFVILVILEIEVFAAGVERYAIYVGSNNGGKSRQKLLYAGSDAESIKNVMVDVGGISETNSYLLIDPSKKQINAAIEEISEKIQNNKTKVSRSEFLFYYSGHSDEEALLLGENRYDYSTLKQIISNIPSDIHVVILDSCYSGNFIRTKGGQKKKPFLMDDSSVVKGHAYLSSSSETEFSQESDDIEASYFTNAVITGLRGAADTSGDKKVTLNELYSYAFNDTLRKTEETKAGPQHPNYNITLVGSGDLILSDFSESDSVVSIAKNVQGKVIIRDKNAKLVSEINKTEQTPIMLALPQGKYSVVIIGDSTLQGEFEVKKDEAFVLEQTNLVQVEAAENRTRGNQEFFFDVEEELNKMKPRTSNLPFDYTFYFNFPINTVFEGALSCFAIQEDMSVLSLLPIVLKNKNSIHTFEYMASTGFRKPKTKEKVSIVAGTDLEINYLSCRQPEKHFETQYFLEPCLGFVFSLPESLPLEGMGLIFYPASIPVYTSYGDRYFKVKSSIALEGTFTHKNLLFGFEEKWDFYWRNGKFTPDFTIALNIGAYVPSSKNWEAVKYERINVMREYREKTYYRTMAKEIDLL